MSFVQGTKIFTDNGFKNIEDISGRDKVLVRNFIGDAQFIQPYALKKQAYSGIVYEIGAKNWNFTLTPEHIVVYDHDDKPVGRHFKYVAASDLEIDPLNRIYRKFRFSPDKEYKKEQLIEHTKFGKRYIGVSNEDWFVLLGYILARGYIQFDSKRPSLNLFVRQEEDIAAITDIIDRMGLRWSLLKRDRYFVRVSNNNNLVARVITRLGSPVRKDMYLTDKIIYESNRQLAQTLVDTLLKASQKPDTEKSYQLYGREKFIDSLLLLCTLHGYGATKVLSIKKGTKTALAYVTEDVYGLNVFDLTKTYSAQKITAKQYDGNVYSIDLFDGQVYIKNKSVPVWVNPK